MKKKNRFMNKIKRKKKGFLAKLDECQSAQFKIPY